MTEMTRHYNKIVGVIRRAIEEYMDERLPSKIGDNTVIREEDLSEDVRSLRPYFNFVTRSFGLSHTVLNDLSCSYRCISYGANTLEKVSLDKKEKCSSQTQETNTILEIHVEIILFRFSLLGAMHAK
jgi:hypothetical protein